MSLTWFLKLLRSQCLIRRTLIAIYTEQEYIYVSKTVDDFGNTQSSIKFLNLVKFLMNLFTMYVYLKQGHFLTWPLKTVAPEPKVTFDIPKVF